MFSKNKEQEIMTPQEKQIEAYVETIAELNKEVAKLKLEIERLKNGNRN